MESVYNALHDDGYLYVTMECGGVQKQLIFEYCDEWQVWSCWIRGEKHFNGDGDNAYLAFQDMIERMPGTIIEYQRIHGKSL